LLLFFKKEVLISLKGKTMTEAVRLVIWDLDETFWQGTLTEGGIAYQRHAHHLVITLAKRGIISSICSKNDIAPVRDILQAHGLWDYFIMPSISWEPKGPRIAQLVEAVQLRPPTILFIDDNPANLQEALHFVPGLQIADETLVDSMLDDPRFRGKDDSKLTRLAQYRLLEQRQAEQQASGGDTRDFLRASDIRVRLIHDLDGHVDRIAELINRTNQLNFTKQRLPDESEPAREAVRALLGNFRLQSGLVSVRDRYGDHGLTGFYTVDTITNRLVHFCFSCRTQNMGVERWLYERLGRPGLKVQGEVTTDIFAADMPDWIRLARDGEADDAAGAGARLGRVLVRGGCDLQVLAHYLGIAATSVHGEYHFHRFGKAIRVDHSACVRLALDGLSEPVLRALEAIAYRKEDFDTALTGGEAFDTYVFSFQSDAVQALYQHKELGISVPFGAPHMRNSRDLSTMTRAEMEKRLPDPLAMQALDALLANYRFAGLITEEVFKANLRRMIDATSPGAKLFIILGNERFTDAKGVARVHEHQQRINCWITDVAATVTRDVRPVPVAEHIHHASEMADVNHFAPKVYYRLSEALIASAMT
jgi:FkbH-like protein